MFKNIKENLLLWFQENAIKFFDRDVIDFEDIRIPKKFKQHYPKKSKMQERWSYYNKYQEPKVSMIVDKDNVLVDGYTTYLICKKIGVEKASVKRV